MTIIGKTCWARVPQEGKPAGSKVAHAPMASGCILPELGGAMRVFVSWSGEYSRQVALLLRELLPCMLQGIDVFVSAHDIESGSRWAQRLAQELDGSQFGIICLAPDNCDRPWLLFEAGALAKHIEGKACGLLIGGLTPSAISGPLSQFQHRSFDSDSVRHLLQDLNKHQPKPLESGQVDRVHEKWWPDLADRYSRLPSTPMAVPPPARPVEQVLDELVDRVRAIQRALPGLPYPRVKRTALELHSDFVANRLTEMTPAQRALAFRLALRVKKGSPLDIESEDVSDVGALLKSSLLKQSPEGISMKQSTAIALLSFMLPDS